MEASPPVYCGIEKRGGSICVQNLAGHAYWTSTCQGADDCPTGMTCVRDGAPAELAADSPKFGQCERLCESDADCLRCDLGCNDGTCSPRGG